jgi:hypothetical protein
VQDDRRDLDGVRGLAISPSFTADTAGEMTVDDLALVD